MNTLLHLSATACLHAAVALVMLGLGLEGMGGDEVTLPAEAEQ